MACAIVLAAGRGERLGGRVPKALVKLAGVPLVCHSLKTLSANSQIKGILVVVNEHNRSAVERAVLRHAPAKVAGFVIGGRRRQDSVSNALAALVPRTSLVLVHDAARPFIDRRVLEQLLLTAGRYSAAIPAVPVKATVKEVSLSAGRMTVSRTADRTRLWEVQTPQAFEKNVLLEAYRRFGQTDVTDDASLVEKLGVAVQVVCGSYAQIKVTTPEDLVLAEAIAARRKTFGL